MRKYLKYVETRGVAWTCIYLLRRGIGKRDWIDRRLLALEERRFILGQDTLTAELYTRQFIRDAYEEFDWEGGGEEWGKGNEWKAQVVENVLRRYIPTGGVVLEIGPGGGRWTEYLLPRAESLILADVSESALDACRRRFAFATNLAYMLVKDHGLDAIHSESVDAVWSYSTFELLGPTAVQSYIIDIARILKPGGVAVIHHRGRQVEPSVAPTHLSEFLADSFFTYLVQQNGMHVIARNTQDIWIPGEIVTVFTKD